jgi:NADH:ubiquinone oxidoreductase subunit 4 (subunit M)
MKKWILLILVASILAGCVKQATTKPLVTDKMAKWQTQYETATKNLTVVQGALVAGVVLSTIACFLGAAKFGVPVLAGCLTGFGLVNAGIYYGKAVAFVGLVFGVGVCGYAIWLNRKTLFIHKQAVEEVVKVAEATKTTTPVAVFANGGVADKTESTKTKELVKQIRTKLQGEQK